MSVSLSLGDNCGDFFCPPADCWQPFVRNTAGCEWVVEERGEGADVANQPKTFKLVVELHKLLVLNMYDSDTLLTQARPSEANI